MKFLTTLPVMDTTAYEPLVMGSDLEASGLFLGKTDQVVGKFDLVWVYFLRDSGSRAPYPN